MPSPPPEVTAALLERTDAMLQGLTDQLAAFLRRVLAFVRASGEEAVPDAVEALVDAVEAGQREVADLTRVYVETVLAIETPRSRTRPRTEPPITDHDTLVQQWTELVERHFAAADDDVVAEAEEILRQSVRDAHRGAIETPQASFYRRVIHPELSEGGTCGLCVAAAHRRYRTANLAPIHDGCNCTVLPGTEDADPGKDLNDADLEKVYAATGTTDGWTLKQSRFAYDDQGDLKPVKERLKQGKRNAQASATAGAGLSEKSVEWLRSQIATTERLRESDWRTKQLQRLRDELAKR